MFWRTVREAVHEVAAATSEPTDEHAEANRAVRSIPSRLDRGGAGKTTWKDWDP